jgi:hypothetical protein
MLLTHICCHVEARHYEKPRQLRVSAERDKTIEEIRVSQSLVLLAHRPVVARFVCKSDSWCGLRSVVLTSILNNRRSYAVAICVKRG